jgi:hypothetical protein
VPGFEKEVDKLIPVVSWYGSEGWCEEIQFWFPSLDRREGVKELSNCLQGTLAAAFPVAKEH